MSSNVYFLPFVFLIVSAPSVAHEVTQRVGGFLSSSGESRSMARVLGRVEAPKILSGELQAGLSINASVERLRYEDDAKPDYMKKNFDSNQRIDQSFSFDNDWTLAKRTEVTVGASFSGDGVTSSQSRRSSLGQWMLNDQLRLGLAVSSSETRRPRNEIVDYDSSTIALKPRVISNSAGVLFKAILNPTTMVNGDYNQVLSTDRPRLHSWSAGVKQYIPPCDCAVHADVGRVINLGDLNTNMSSGELTGSQWSLSYLQTLAPQTHSRISYRFAREDEFTRAYQEHLVFGSDSYTAAVSHEFQKTRIAGAERPLLMDLAATRYIDNRGSAATTMEMGAGVKF